MIVAQVVGAESVVSKFKTLPHQIHAKVKDRMHRLVLTLLNKVKEEKLDGQVLKNRTGTLYRSINQRVDDQGSSIVGSVGTNLVYARAHEFGVDQEVQIREHLRTITTAWGRELKNPVICLVRAHQAHMHLPERSFLRSALDEMRPQVREQLLQAMRESGL